MTRKRKFLASVAAGAIVAGSLAIGVGPAGSATVTVNCVAADDVLQGSATLNGNPIAADSQAVLDLIGTQVDPPLAPPVSLTNPLTGSVDPAQVEPGTNTVDLTTTLELSSTLVEGLGDSGVTALNLSNMSVTVEPGSNVTGPDVTFNPANAVVNPAAPSFPSATVTETFDVTGDIGDIATWNLVEAEVGVNFSVPPSQTIPGTVVITFGLRCTQTSAGAFISAPVLVVDPNGPVVNPLSATTDEGVPVDIDLTQGIEEGPFPTDLSTLSIVTQPSNGSVSLGDDGVATYTPADGFFGEDTFVYQVCTTEQGGSTTTTETPPVDTPVVDAVVGAARGTLVEPERFCNANVVTVTVLEAGGGTPTPGDDGDDGDDGDGGTPPPATPQGQAPNFTG